MGVFVEFEEQVVRSLLGRRLAAKRIEAVLAGARLVAHDSTPAGYLLTVRHDLLPRERTVCSEPILGGRSGELSCGFLLIVEDCELTLECHAWGDTSLPDDIRARPLAIEIEDSA